MKASAARRLIQQAGRRGLEGGVEFSAHALDEAMMDDGVTIFDVLHLLEHATEVIPQDDGGRKWKAYEPLLVGDAYAAVLVILEADRIRVVTTHDPP